MFGLRTMRAILMVLILIVRGSIEELIPMSTNLHGELTLLCRIDNMKDTTVYWSFLLPDGKERNVAIGMTNIDPTFKILNPKPNQRNLKISYMTEDRAGMYTCKSEPRNKDTVIEAMYNVTITSEEHDDDNDRPGTMVVNTQPGEVEQLTCFVKGYKPNMGKVSWYKDTDTTTTQISQNETSLVSTASVQYKTDQWSLTVKIVDIQSGGLYICRVGNTEYAVYDVKVKGDDKPIYNLIKPLYRKDAMLSCVFPTFTRQRVSWRTNNNRVITQQTVHIRRYQLEITQSNTILTVKNVYPSGSDGIYTVLLDNRPLDSCIFKIEVQKSPSVDISQSSPALTFREGETAELRCVMNGRPEPDITWGRKRKIENPEMEKLEVEGSVLFIPNITRYAADEYICIGTNVIDGKEEADMWSIDVNVNFGPEIEVFKSVVSIYDNRDVRLHCLIQAGQTPTTDWINTDTGNKITSNFRYHPENLEALKGYSAYIMTLTLLVNQSVGHVFNMRFSCKAIVDGQIAEKVITVRDLRQNGRKDSDVHIVPYNESFT